ncbi:MAG: hypothetical protein ACTSP3_12550 [Candidatus Heimdallarchaeaceae archaeon]
MLKEIALVILGMSLLYLIYPYINPQAPTGKFEYPIIECPVCPTCPPPCPGDLKLATKFDTQWALFSCQAKIDYAIASFGNKEANGVKLYLSVENPALGKVRDSKTIDIGNIAIGAEPKFGTSTLSYPCDDDIVKITARVTDNLGRSDVKYYEKRKD